MPRKESAMLLILVFLAAGQPQDVKPGPGRYLVAVDGRDSWSGTLPAPNDGKTDGPFATLERARDAVRELKRTAGGLREPVTVRVRGGRYPLARPLTFTPEDSGAEGRPITYCAYPGEKPVISGGVRIEGWRKHDERLWVADVPWVKERKRPFHQLFVNGVRRTRARMPNQGSYFYTKRLTLTADTHPVCLGMWFHKEDLPPLQDPQNAVICLFHNWVNSFNYIGEADWARGRIKFARPAGVFFLGPSVRFYVENVREGLDAPGEWFLDVGEGRLYYSPQANEDMAQAEVIAPALASPLVKVAGDPDAGLYVEHLAFKGLSFQHADADLSRTYPHSVQGAHTQKGAFFATALRHSVIEDCEFTRLGEHAVSLREACAWNTVTRCHVHDVGGGGIYLSEAAPRRPDQTLLTAHNTVDNNLIHDGGHLFRAGCGVFLGGSASFNEITHNEICDLSWMGVHLGWSWTGRAPAYTHHNTVAYNHIHHIGNGVLNDIGGIYTLG
ncbi:MAG: right-handed parallel beta-helix repeat-containing protein, partial [Planctomycetes bacterium]|nr:right-handed parallel beta-helix repeat-containing protein [Planctomycetota bacterium]